MTSLLCGIHRKMKADAEEEMSRSRLKLDISKRDSIILPSDGKW